MAKWRALQTVEGYTVYYPADVPIEQAAADIKRRRAEGTLQNDPAPGRPVGPPIQQMGNQYDEQAPGGGLQIGMQPWPPLQEFEEEAPQPQEYAEANQGPPIGILKGNAHPQLAGRDLNTARAGSILNGMTFEAGDEIVGMASAGLDTLTGTEPGMPLGQGPPKGKEPMPFWSKYDYYRDRARALDERLLGERPIEGYGLRVAAGIASGVGALPKLSSMAIERVAPEMAKRLAASKILPQAGTTSTKAAATLGDKVVDSALQGGIAGGLTGFNSGETDDPEASLVENAASRTLSGLTGTAFGTGLGAAAPPVMATLGGAGRYIGQTIAPSMVNPERRALDVMASGIGDDLSVSPNMSTPGQSPLQHMAAGGQPIDDVTLMDISPNVRQMAGHVARSGGKGGTEASEFITRRQEGDPLLGEQGGGQWTKMIRHVKDVVGSGNTRALVRKLAEIRAKAAKPAYDRAFSHPDPDNAAFKDMLKSDRVRAGARLGAKIMKDLGELPEDFKLPDIDADSAPVPIKVWHVVKMGLDAQHEALIRAGKRLEAAGVSARRKRLLEMLDDATDGDYGKARAQYAGYSSMMEAVEEGENLFKTSLGDLEDILSQYSATPGLKQLFTEGMSKALIEKITAKGIDANSAWIMYKSPDIQMRLGMTLSPGQYQSFIKRAMAESEKFKSFMELKGSQTDSRANIGEMVEEAIAGGGSPESIIAAASGGSAFQGVMRPIWSWFTQNGPSGMHQAVKDEFAKMASETDPVKQQRIVDGIMSAANRVLGRQRRQRLGRGARSGGLAVGASSLGQDTYPDNSQVPPPGFKQASDGKWYAPDPKRPGAYNMWERD